jgi:threonine aldolase
MTAIDLRSDTVTLPSPAMRAALAAAPVGDDQFGEDPSVNALQAHVSALLGKEAALWMPSGTMANQVALRTLTHPGDDVIVSQESHAVWHETGAAAANSGVQFTAIGAGGVFSAADFIAAIKPRGHILYPPTTLVEIENTHNRAGGVVFPQSDIVAIAAAAREHGIAGFLDGARLWNVAAATGAAPALLAAPFDLVSVAFSKGLGAPGGSMLAGSGELIARCQRYRRMFGGAMRQAGHFAAAARHALDHNLPRLQTDHENARLFAAAIATSDRVLLDTATVQTNIVVFRLAPDAPDAATVVARARDRGLLIFAFGPRTLRAVTHLDVTRAQCVAAAEIVLSALNAKR